jgi:RNA polymerase sigma-70 factor (ECF subfamily)
LCCQILKDEFAAEDALQTAVLKAWKDRWGCRESFPAWFHKIAKNVALDMHREAYRRRRAPLDPEMPDNREVLADRTIWGHDLGEVVLKLSPEERTILELHALEGHTLKEVAEIMEMRYPAARQKYSRLEAKIRRILGPDYLLDDRRLEGDDGPVA